MSFNTIEFDCQTLLTENQINLKSSRSHEKFNEMKNK